jgi:hypothetical protein
MSDIEHELMTETSTLHDEVARLTDLAARAITLAIAAQDTHEGGHDPWLDDALASLDAGGGGVPYAR